MFLALVSVVDVILIPTAKPLPNSLFLYKSHTSLRDSYRFVNERQGLRMLPYSTKWGKLPQLQLPSSMVTKGVLNLPTADIRVLVVLMHIHRSRFIQRTHDDIDASVKVTRKVLMDRTGLQSATTISHAVKSLEEAGFVSILRDRKGSTKHGAVSSEYFLRQPGVEGFIPLTSGRNILGPLNITYFTIPTCLITDAERWSLARLEASEVRLYIAMLWAANYDRSLEIKRTNVQLYCLAKLTLATFKTALESLQDKGLINVTQNDSGRMLTVVLCNPGSGEPIHLSDGNEENDPENYSTTDAKSVTRRLNLNTANVEQREQLLRESVPEGDPVIPQSNGDLLILCPFHGDNKPSCSVSPRKSCFHCFACKAKGTYTELIAKLTGVPIGSAIKLRAKSMGLTAEFRDPDSNAIAIYDYYDVNSKLLKRVLRYPNHENGDKRITQRKPLKGGWIYEANGLGPMLYNAHLIEFYGTIAIVEGEKDCDTVNALKLNGRGSGTLGITSGSATSWDSTLAKSLRGKVVVILPDNDEAGRAYAADVSASLDAEQIKHKTVSFAGTGAKDVSDYIALGKTAEDLVKLIDSEWVGMPDGSRPGVAAELVDEVTPI